MTNAEQHTKACFARALIPAVENARDSDDVSVRELYSFAQYGDLADWATSYLTDGLLSCTCGAEK